MNEITIVVEGETDVFLIKRILRSITGVSFRFFAAQGKFSLATLGRNILFHEGGSLLVVTDADTFDVASAQEQCGLMRTALRNVSPDGQFNVFAFLPALEIIFFEMPDTLIRRFGAGVVDPAVIERGHYKPGATLNEILKSSGDTPTSFFKSLGEEELEYLRRGEQCRGLVAAVETLTPTVAL